MIAKSGSGCPYCCCSTGQSEDVDDVYKNVCGPAFAEAAAAAVDDAHVIVCGCPSSDQIQPPSRFCTPPKVFAPMDGWVTAPEVVVRDDDVAVTAPNP